MEIKIFKTGTERCQKASERYCEVCQESHREMVTVMWG